MCNTISVQYTLLFNVMDFLNLNSMKNSLSSEKKIEIPTKNCILPYIIKYLFVKMALNLFK